MKVSGRQSARIRASPGQCYAALLDFASYPDWFPGVKRAEPVIADDGAPTVRLLFSAGIGALPDVECVLRHEAEPDRRLTPRVIEGDLAVAGPGWLLEPGSDNTTQATYEVELEMNVPGGFVAERAFKGPARRYLIEQPPERLKRHVEGGSG